MSAISEKQTKTEELHNYPFEADIFRRTFNRYVQRFNTAFIVSVLLICSPFIAYAIAWYLGEARVDVTGFLNLLHAGESLLLDVGFPHIVFGVFASGIISVGHFAFGFISVGNFSFGVISIGMFCSCGIISMGVMLSVGVIAIGYARAYGVITIAVGSKKPFEKSTYMNGKAFGVIAIGRQAHAVYSLSYGEEGEGVYQFSPKRQDPEAVALFTRWFKKFKNTFVAPA
ncbi:hypothetical protein C6503_16775 [Candidatus Poribacteria bacterium]|nr:MAG: hypothetical protein C6503_16775 [Candidatus Poribacteria bacterium]